jgi:steroid 5-alpha reductase family enzyme
MLLWWGVFAAAAGGLASPGQRVAAVASPLFVAALLRFASGVPIQERQFDYHADPGGRAAG